MQNEITKPQPLLNELGRLSNPGFAKKPYWVYDRSKIKANPLRIKEWDYYLITKDDFGIAFTIADNSYMGFVSVSFLDFKSRKYETFSVMKFLTRGKLKLPSSSKEGVTKFKNKKIDIVFSVLKGKRQITCEIPKFKRNKSLKADIILIDEPDESMVIATPFRNKPKAFYYNQKINCLGAKGKVILGEEEFDFNQGYGVLDWGRGVWPYNNQWYWGTASGMIDGKTFGLNMGYGFGDLSRASENMIFYDGKAHKVDKIEFIIPKEKNKFEFLKEWKFVSNDKKINLTFTPILDRYDNINILLLVSTQHQVFGKLNGHVILDDGKEITVKDFLASAEVVKNRW